MLVERLAAEERLSVLGWRELPVDPAGLGPTALSVAPRFRQVFVAAAESHPAADVMDLERRAYCLRRRAERLTAAEDCPIYLPSLSARTVVYKGMLTTEQLGTFFPDLHDHRVRDRAGAGAQPLQHQHVPVLAAGPPVPADRAQRRDQHDQGQPQLDAGPGGAAGDGRLRPGELDRLLPICTEGLSDSASFDEVLELLHLAGRSLPHAVLMMIPEAWENHAGMDPARRAFYEYHANLMEPWDGPAAVAFTDGTVIGAVLDRNGLRPARWWRTDDDLVVLASEAGVLDVDPARVVAKGRLQPGRMFLVDTAAGRIIDDDEIKGELAAAHPYADWLHAGSLHLDTPAAAAAGAAAARRRGPPAAGLRLHRGGAAGPAGADGGHRRRADRLDGHRHPGGGAVGAAAAALRLLQPALRPGHQPAAGRDPGGAGDVAGVHRSARTTTCSRTSRPPAARWCCPSRCWTTTSWPSWCTSPTTATCPASPPPS